MVVCYNYGIISGPDLLNLRFEFTLEMNSETSRNDLELVLLFDDTVQITRRKVVKVAKIKDANYGCKDEGNESVSQFSEVSVLLWMLM